MSSISTSKPCSFADCTVDLRAERGELLLRGGAVDVERGHHHPLRPALLEALGDLGGGGRLARALQPDHHHDRGRRDVEVELAGIGAEHLDQRVVDDLDDLLPRRDRAQHVLADRLFGRLVDELARDRQRHVGFEQRHAHLAHRLTHVRLGQRAAPAQPVEDAAQPVAQRLEHGLFPTNRSRTQKAPAGETSPASVRHRVRQL